MTDTCTGKGKRWLQESHSLKLVPSRDMSTASSISLQAQQRCHRSCRSTSYFLFNSSLHIAISLHSTGRLWTNLSTYYCRSYLPQTSTSSTVQQFLLLGPSGPSPPSGSKGVEYLPTVEQRDAYQVVEVERIEATSASSQPPKDPAITRVEVEEVTFQVTTSLPKHSLRCSSFFVPYRTCCIKVCWYFVTD